jgi:hypothetical protein
VLKLLVVGRNGKEIAADLAISPETVGEHVPSILAKLQVQSRLEAAARSISSEAHPKGTQDPRCPRCSAVLEQTLTVKELEVGVGDEPRKVRIAYCGLHLPCPLPAAQWPTGVGLPVAPPPGTEPASPCGGDDPSSLPPPYSGAEVSIVGAFPMTQSAFGNDPTWSQRILVAVEAPNVIAA